LAEGAARRRRRPGPGGPAPAAGPVRREILVSLEGGEPRVAILENGVTVAVDWEPGPGGRTVGNIYKGRVRNVLPGMQAAFVDIGLERNAFLFVDDAQPGLAVPPGDEPDEPEQRPPRPRADIAACVRPGEDVLVQVAKEPAGTKGARVTRAFSFPGRLLVLMPGVDHVGVSRSIADGAERQRLRAAAAHLRPPGAGLIVRTAAAGASEEDLARDAALLAATWQDVLRRAAAAAAPALVHRDLGTVERALRDHLDAGTLVVTDRPEELERLRALAAAALAQGEASVALAAPAERRRGLFAARGVEAEIERALGRRVALQSGAYLVIDQTEALTAIDVNTGRFVGAAGSADHAATFLAANLEAAAEIARQLRLREIGGIIVVDFIDMDLPEHRRQVLEALESACASDRARPQVLGITALGLVEMTRKKARQSLRELLTRPCPACEGRGRVLSEGAAARRIRRELLSVLRAAPEAEAALVEVHPGVAGLLIGAGGQELAALRQESGRTVFVRGAADCPPDEMRLRRVGTVAEVEAEARPVREGQILELQVEGPHASSRDDGIARVEGYVVDIEGAAARVGQRVQVEIVRAFRTYARARLVGE
jgi:ribonuclease G